MFGNLERLSSVNSAFQTLITVGFNTDLQLVVGYLMEVFST